MGKIENIEKESYRMIYDLIIESYELSEQLKNSYTRENANEWA